MQDIVRELRIDTLDKAISFFFETNKIMIWDKNRKSHKTIKINEDDWFSIELWINKTRKTEINKEDREKIYNELEKRSD